MEKCARKLRFIFVHFIFHLISYQRWNSQRNDEQVERDDKEETEKMKSIALIDAQSHCVTI